MDGTTERERDIFASALERATTAERMAFVDGACGANVELRSRVTALLSAYDLAGGFLPLDAPPHAPLTFTQTFADTQSMFAVAEKPGDSIGPYKLREKVGEGGCGVVYVADQEQPVRRRIALKVIKLGMDTRSVIARFEAERQALAIMDHPNIAKVLDAGATTAGRPYFVMELVRGIRITDYCDQNKLSTRARLDLFIKVCRAIQHAHQKGIIHRDIKPSNILVTLHDAVPVPKIIDFGIAKAIQGKLTDLTVYTDLHQFIGTPAYMSPEQAQMSALDIDTRADIYSLGVLLYELLTGKTPLDTKELLRSGIEAMRKKIRETEPLRPSTRLSTMVNAEVTAIAERHSAEAPRLIHLLRGDLDWIVMKALEKDRTRRYETASALAMDVERHLSHEPITARPQSSAYRFRKLVRRNKLAFAAAAAVLTALVLGLFGTLSQWRQAERNHQDAEANLYVADMNRAAQLLEDLGPVGARGLLERHSGQTRLHGFEWRYLWKQCLGDAAYTFASHTNRVWKIEFSANGETLATLDDSGVLRLLKASTGTESVCLTNVSGLAGFRTNADELVLIKREEKDRQLIRFNARTRRTLASFPTEGSLGWLAGLLRDRVTVVVPGAGTQLSLVDTDDGTIKGQLALPSHDFICWQAVGEACAVSGDGKLVFCLDNAQEDGTLARLSVRELKSGKVLATYLDDAPGTPNTTISDRVYVLRFLPDGQTVIWATRDGYLHRWRWGEPSSTAVTQHAHRGIIWDIDFSPDAKWVATAGEDHTVRVWDAENLNEVRVFRGHSGPVYTLAFSPAGRWLASAGHAGIVKLWDLQQPGDSGEVPLIAARQLANRLIFAADSRAAAIGTDDNGVSVFGTEPGRVRAAFDSLFFPDRFTLDGSRIECLGGSGEISTGKVDPSPAIPEPCYTWTHDISPDGRLLFRSFRGMKSGDMSELVDLRERRVITNFSPRDVIVGACFAQDGQTLLASEGSGELHWWSVAPTGLKLRRTVQVGQFSRAIALSPDASIVALGGLSRVSLVDYRTGAIRHCVFGHAHEITGLAFSPDGETLASCSLDGTIKLWNLRIMQEVCTITFDVKHALGKEIGVSGIGFAPDGNSLWAFSRSGVVKYWRAALPGEIPSVRMTGTP